MDWQIAVLLVQDGLTNGAVYALLGIAIVLVFAVTRIIFVPQDRIVYLSELYFADQFLFIADGYGLDWLRALDAVQALGADIFVPGHGPIPADPRETRQGLARFRQMIVDVRDAVQQEIARGATEDEAVATIRWPQYERLLGYDAQRETAVRRFYQQLTGKLP